MRAIRIPTLARRGMVMATAFTLMAVACDDDDDGRGTGHYLGIGNACAEDADCPTGTCYLGPGGGYCTSKCANEGSTAECPVDTVCKPIQGGDRRCLLICGSDHYCPEDAGCGVEWCPEGSSCVNVSETDLQACEPEPG
jgi:hypothetical protein